MQCAMTLTSMATATQPAILDVSDRTVAPDRLDYPLLTFGEGFGYRPPMTTNSDNTEIRIVGSETADDTIPVEVTRIEPLDLTPLTIDRVRYGSETLRIEPALELLIAAQSA
jgi:hypothetical protein